jgi:hypothetical protein
VKLPVSAGSARFGETRAPQPRALGFRCTKRAAVAVMAVHVHPHAAAAALQALVRRGMHAIALTGPRAIARAPEASAALGNLVVAGAEAVAAGVPLPTSNPRVLELSRACDGGADAHYLQKPHRGNSACCTKPSH